MTCARTAKPWASDKHDIPTFIFVFGIEMPGGLPQETFGSIALHGAAHFAARRDADTTSTPIVTPDNQHQERVCPGFPFIKDPPDVTAAPESNSPFHDSVAPAIAGWADSSPRSRVSHRRCETAPTTSHVSRLAALPVPLLRFGLANTQQLAALLTTPLENPPAALARSTRKETMSALSLSLLRLIRSLWHSPPSPVQTTITSTPGQAPCGVRLWAPQKHSHARIGWRGRETRPRIDADYRA